MACGLVSLSLDVLMRRHRGACFLCLGVGVSSHDGISGEISSKLPRKDTYPAAQPRVFLTHRLPMGHRRSRQIFTYLPIR